MDNYEKRIKERYQYLLRQKLNNHSYRHIQYLVKITNDLYEPSLNSSRGTLIEWLVQNQTKNGIDCQFINQM
ncbi:hypothetical protein NIES4102_41410 (plasmid) [Chondrocystis sp. NIES-4102]|nr:hypothetical protein NIES4102_41410 [Chondrocystis sp. NIES-4102]